MLIHLFDGFNTSKREPTVDVADAPREYDREWTAVVSPSIRRRTAYDHDRGTVTRFLVQLEYRDVGDWRPVVRYDHDARGAQVAAHDVTEDGLHIDIYREEDKHATEYITGPLPAGQALDHAEDHLAKNLQRFIRRYEQWHGINSR